MLRSNLKVWTGLAVALITGVVAAERSWVPLPVLPLARGGAATGWVADRLVVAGGSYWQAGMKHWSTRVDAFDPKRDRWDPLPPLPRAVSDGGTAAHTDTLYLLGGVDTGAASALCWRLSRRDGAWRWERLPDLPAPRCYGTAFHYRNKLFLAGGCANPADLHTTTRECLVLDLKAAAPGWKPAASLPAPGRCLAGGAVVEGRPYLFGGCFANPAGKPLNLAETLRYDVDADRWQRGVDLPIGLRAPMVTSLGGGRAALLGGYSGAPDDLERFGPASGFENRTWIFDGGRFRAGRSLPAPVAGAGGAAAAGTIYLAGGEDQARSRTDRVWSIRVRQLATPE